MSAARRTYARTYRWCDRIRQAESLPSWARSPTKTARAPCTRAACSQPAMSGGAAIDEAFGERVELRVGRLLLLERPLEDAGAVVAAKLLRPRDQRSVARDLVVLDRLRGGDQRRVEHLLVLDLAGHLLGFLDDAVDGRAVDRLGVDAVHAENFLDAGDVILGLLEVALERLLEQRFVRLLDHVGQRLHDLFLG